MKWEAGRALKQREHHRHRCVAQKGEGKTGGSEPPIKIPQRGYVSWP